MVNNRFESINQWYFRSGIGRELTRDRVSPETTKAIADTLSHTFLEVKQQLGITVPIIARPSDIVTDARIIANQDPKKITYAFFSPGLNATGELTDGEMVLMRPSLVVYGMVLDRRRGKEKITPWELIRDIAHELKHASQWQNDHRAVEADIKVPYTAQAGEYDARMYSYEYLNQLKPLSMVDRVDRYFVLHDIHDQMKHILQKRKKLGLK